MIGLNTNYSYMPLVLGNHTVAAPRSKEKCLAACSFLFPFALSLSPPSLLPLPLLSSPFAFSREFSKTFPAQRNPVRERIASVSRAWRNRTRAVQLFWIVGNEGWKEEREEERRKDGGKERRKGRRTAEDSKGARGGKKEGKKARSPAPRTTGNPIIIIIAGESIVALDRIGSVWPGPRIGTRYTATVYRSDGSTMVHRAPFRRCNVQVSSYRRGW